jgi:ElaB/YqjD/DUF883 family membrane-anchored ribosome-binding protein
MAQHNGHRSAELEREVEAQRSRVESTIGEIKDRLTPGQLVDELLSYTKHGGAHFASNLGHTITANPLPATLLGVSLAWLMAGPKLGMGDGKGHEWGSSKPEYKAIGGGSIQRVRHAPDASGGWYSEFTDDSGASYRAPSDSAGNRMGHFVDDTGKAFAGFFDETGKRITEFRDEAGNLLDQATGWANHTWHDARWTAGQRVGAIASSAMHMGSDLQQNATRMSRDAMRMLEDQPLVMGALAFAAGAAIGAAVPHTRQEDELMGEMADNVKQQAGHIASDLYEEGKQRAGEMYEGVSEKAGEIYGDAKQKLASGTEQSPGQQQENTRH